MILSLAFLFFPVIAGAYTCNDIDMTMGQCGASMAIINNKGNEIQGTRQSCEPWQTIQPLYCGTSDNEYWQYFTCLCDPSCTGAGTSADNLFKHYYYDDPAYKTDGAKAIEPAADGSQSIALPAVLAWDKIDSGASDADSGWVYSYSTQYGCGNNKMKASDFKCITAKGITVDNLKDMPDANGRTFGGDNYIFEIKNAKDLNLTDEQKRST